MKRLLVLSLALAVLAGCSTFEADYAKQAELKSNAPVEGAWIGRWQSTKGHGGGELRAVFTSDGKSGAMSADRHFTGQFKAKWGFFTSEYSSPVSTRSDLKTSSTTLHVETDLGVMVGKYTMDATSTSTSISGTYKAAGDDGTIELKRP